MNSNEKLRQLIRETLSDSELYKLVIAGIKDSGKEKLRQQLKKADKEMDTPGRSPAQHEKKIKNKSDMTKKESINENDCICSKECTWELFEEYGLRMLNAIGYQGDDSVFDTVKEDLKAEGWDYDEI